ncbi:hypothetical protein BD769DRAFT_1396186 [Suillus cothurnatus]|nr:hypothetical protein BD769DRAFT_1396186 [Suillus cothurnatus]
MIVNTSSSLLFWEQDNVTDLNTNMTSMHQDLASMKEAIAYNFNNLSTQFVGIVYEFSCLSDDMYRHFDQWSEKAVSSVVEKNYISVISHVYVLAQVSILQMRLVVQCLSKTVSTMFMSGAALLEPYHAGAAESNDRLVREFLTDGQQVLNYLALATRTFTALGTRQIMYKIPVIPKQVTCSTLRIGPKENPRCICILSSTQATCLTVLEDDTHPNASHALKQSRV